MRARLRWFAIACALFSLVACRSLWAIEVAGELVVDVNAANYEAGSDTWTNAGSYTDFTAVGEPGTITIGEAPAVTFDGVSAFVGSDTPPDEITSFETRSIEAWVFNPSIDAEETVVSWGKRGGPEGTNLAFNYGNHGNFGAVGHWGGGSHDVGWVDNDFTFGAPEAYQWHHLAYVHDEFGVTTVYANGELQNEEDTAGLWGDLETHPDTAIAIAAQWEGSSNFDNVGDPAQLTGGLRGTLAIGQLRVHSDALDPAQIAANYEEEKALYAVNPEIPPALGGSFTAKPLPAAPIHRWSFNNPESDDASGAELTDSIGGAHGTVIVSDFGDIPEFSGTGLFLPGGPSEDAPYADLPNGLISGLDAVTIEAWVTHEGNQNWSRIFDFGSNSPGGDDGELFEPGDDNGGDTQGLDYLLLSAQRGENEIQHRFEWRNEDPEGGGVLTVDFDVEKELPEDLHFAVVVGPETIEEVDFLLKPTGNVLRGVKIYANGELVGESETDFELSDINDVNNWLGRSNWTNDANFEGSFDEFRIYDYELSGDEVAGSIEAGPNELNVMEGSPLDNDGDGSVGISDLAGACAAGNIAELQAELGLVAGDIDGGGVAFSDFLIMSNSFGGDGTYAQGDLDCNGSVEFADFLVLSNNFGEGVATTATPEPSGALLALLGLGMFNSFRRRRDTR